MNSIGDTSAFVNPTGQLLLTRRGKTIMDGVGIVFEFYTAPLYSEHPITLMARFKAVHFKLSPSSFSSSSSRSHLFVGSLRQTQFSSSQYCHGLHPSSFRWPHVSVDTVHPSLLRSSSHSSPGWYHLQSLSSYVVLVSPLYQTTSVALSCTSL